MAAGILLLALALGLSPGGALEGTADELPAVEVAGPVGVGVEAGSDGVALAAPVALPLDVDTALQACPTCPLLGVEAGSEAAAQPSADAEAAGSAGRSPLAALQDAPPAVLFAGSSLAATVLAFLAWLLRPALGLFSRIEDGHLADHPLRRRALDFIDANPGATLQDVRRSLGIAWGTTVYHLGRLERAGLVAVRHQAGRRGHWPLGKAPARDALAPTGQALADLVRSRPGLSQNELARLAGIGAPAACKQLQRLEGAGLVAAQRVGRSRHYVPTALLEPMRPLAIASA